MSPPPQGRQGRDAQPLTLFRILSRVLLVLIGAGLAFGLYRWVGGGKFFSWEVATPNSPLVTVFIGGVGAALVGLWLLTSSGKFSYGRSQSVLVSVSLVWLGFGSGLFGPAALTILASWAEPGRSDAEPGRSDSELLRFAFVDPLPTGTTLLTEPINSLGELRERLDTLFISTSDFWTLEERMEITGYSQLPLEDGPPILKVTFEIDGHARAAFAYGVLIEPESAPSGAALLVPGTGENQGLRVAQSESDNYHCCLWEELEGFAKFALIKPNQGARAIHNGFAKLGSDFYVVDFLNRGGSYSASYIAEAAALTEFLSSYYSTTSLIGLSQGGEAALITSLLKAPDVLVVSSGYSVLSEEQAKWAGAGSQIIIPGLSHRLQFEYLSRELQPPTLFTWGKEEVGTYGIEARDGNTCRRTKVVERFHCLVHADGHVFPEREIVKFVQSELREIG